MLCRTNVPDMYDSVYNAAVAEFGTSYAVRAPCNNNDNFEQVPAFFHFAKAGDGYKINFLGAPASSKSPQYG